MVPTAQVATAFVWPTHAASDVAASFTKYDASSVPVIVGAKPQATVSVTGPPPPVIVNWWMLFARTSYRTGSPEAGVRVFTPLGAVTLIDGAEAVTVNRTCSPVANGPEIEMLPVLELSVPPSPACSVAHCGDSAGPLALAGLSDPVETKARTRTTAASSRRVVGPVMGGAPRER